MYDFGDGPHWGFIKLKKEIKEEKDKAREEGRIQAKKIAQKELRTKIKQELYQEIFDKFDNLSTSRTLQQIEFKPTCEMGVILLFGRFYDILGFERITNIRTAFPDAFAIIRDQKVSIEFEFKLSSVRSHFTQIQEGKKLDYVICWEDDIYLENEESQKIISDFLKINNIKVIELKSELKSFFK